MSQRPNFLVIMSDQQSPHVLGCAGDCVVRTPHLDRLAAGGVRFTASYGGSPLCVPARMTFLTGRHCSDIGVWSNGCILDSAIPTFPGALAAAGYETVLCGRMHFGGPDQRHGFTRRILGDVTQPRYPEDEPHLLLGDIPGATTGQNRAAVETAGPGRTAYQAYDDAFAEYCGLLGDRPARMVREGAWKLAHYHGYDEPQLFHLGEDPGEWRDRRVDPACAQVRERLHRRAREGWDGDRIETAMARMEERRREAARRAASHATAASDHWEMPRGANVFPLREPRRD